MELRNEIKDVVLLAAQRVLSNTTGSFSEADGEKLRDYFEERISRYNKRFPILGLLNELENVADAGHIAAIATNVDMKRQRGLPSLGWDEEQGVFRTPISELWANAILESAAEATEEYFLKASRYFENNQNEQATECLCSAVICWIAATAALLGWPHQDRDDDLRTVVALGHGYLPKEGESIYKLLHQPPSRDRTSTAPSRPQWANRMPYGPETIRRPAEPRTRHSCLPERQLPWPTGWAGSYDDTQRPAGYQPGVRSTLRPGIRQRRQ